VRPVGDQQLDGVIEVGNVVDRAAVDLRQDGVRTWEKQALSARGFRRVGRR
jgi:hypothetical protein